MPLDPHLVPTTPEDRSNTRIADLERRVAALERASSVTPTSGPPAVPGTVVETARAGEVVNRSAALPANGAAVVDKAAGRVYFFDGTVWKYVPIT